MPEGFHIFQRETRFHIYKGESLEPINPKGLKRDAVEAAVTAYLDE